MISWRPSIWPTTARATRPASAANRPSTSACGRIACSTFACWSARSVTSTPGSGGSAAPARSAAVEARKLGSRAQAQQGPLRRRQGTPCPEGFPGTPASAQARGKGHPRTQMLFEQSLPLYRRAGERLGVTLTATAAAADHPQRHWVGGDLGAGAEGIAVLAGHGRWPRSPSPSGLPRGAWRQPSSPGVPELRSGQGRRLRRWHPTCLDPVDDTGYLVDEADATFWGLCRSAIRRPATARARSPARPRPSRRRAGGGRCVQAGRRGPTWTS